MASGSFPMRLHFHGAAGRRHGGRTARARPGGCYRGRSGRIGVRMREAEDRNRRDRRRAGTAERLHRLLASIATFSFYALHRFNRDGCFAACGALSYTTLVSLVPLGVIGLGVLSAFPTLAGSREELLQLLFRNFVPGISAQAAWWFQY